MVLGPLNAQYYDAKLQGPFDKTTVKVKTEKKKENRNKIIFSFLQVQK